MLIDAKNMSMMLEQKIDPKSTALVVVDVQNDFVLPDGVCGRAGDDLSAAPPMIERLKSLIDSARSAGVFIIYVQTIYDEPVLSPALAEQYGRRGFANSICLTGTKGADFVDGIGPNGSPNEIVVIKHRYSAFWGTNIDLMLRSNGISTLVMSGIATEVCVESTARDAFFRDYRIVEASDCVSCFSQERHDASQAIIARSFGQVVPSMAIRDVWNAARPGARNWQPETKAANLLYSLEDRLDPSHTAVVFIDVQNDFCDERGAAGRSKTTLDMVKAAVPRMRRLLIAAREAGNMIIHVRAEYGPHVRNVGSPYRYASARTREGVAWTASAATNIDTSADDLAEVCLPGTWGADFVEGFGPSGPGELVVTKHRFSAFVDTRLELLLRSNGIRTVVLAGVTTNCCVESTARDAVMRDFNLVIAEDGVAVKDMFADLHAASLETMGTYFGRVEPVDAIIGAWGSGAPAKTAAVG